MGKDGPFNATKYGNNDFYKGRDGYSPAAGVGTFDVGTFAEALERDFWRMAAPAGWRTKIA